MVVIAIHAVEHVLEPVQHGNIIEAPSYAKAYRESFAATRWLDLQFDSATILVDLPYWVKA